VATGLIFLFILGWLLNDFLKAWAIFIGSYLISRVIIWLVADVLKIRLLRPLDEAKARRALVSQKPDSMKQTDDLAENYGKMKYHNLRDISKDSKRIDIMTDDAFRTFALAYAYKVQKRIIHIHHFILGIPLMPLTWILYFYQVISWGMLTAGATFALFMSEFYELLTQEWGP